MRALIVFCLFTFASLAQAQDFQTSASHAVILDYETGEVLFNHNGDEPMPPASMSKLMTLLMAFEAIERGALSLDDELPVSEHAWRTGGAASGSSTMFLEVHSRARVDDLIRSIIVQSGNDACIVLAEAISGSESAFAADMTVRARELGLSSARFANSTGWPHPDQRISAIDLARLAAIIIREYPEFYEIFDVREFTYNGIRQFNRNPLLATMDEVDGLKTGHTEESGYGLVASGERDGARRIVVYNGMESERARASEGERLMRAALADFTLVELGTAGDVVGEADLFLGQAETVALRLTEDARVGLHVRARGDLQAEIVYDGPIAAPVAEGDVIARLEVSAPGMETRQFALEAAGTVAKQGLIGRALAGLGSLFGVN
ncbi:D-alanyl-D-alanine carboxypeptidase family protein [Hyphobacterium indicum]|uniref:D-alanyl-D-alanine carboxypeptidase family protein n=1 Tax=Hyphobacterium indicum TaxID=2162714 RepID=UPI000D655854|nr:D-alanyl-D-alanine carboxypeptidase family protein [Hyphobacterium indicum]